MQNISPGLNHPILHGCAPVLFATLFTKCVTSLTLPQALITTTFLEGASYFVDKKTHFSEKLNQNPLTCTFVSVAVSIAAFSILHFASPLFFPIGGTFVRGTTTQLLGSSALKFFPGLFCIQFLFKECFFKKIPIQNANLQEPESAHIALHQDKIEHETNEQNGAQTAPHQSASQDNINPAAPSLQPTTDLNDQNDEHTVPDHSAPQGNIDPSTSSLRLTTDLNDQNDEHTVPDHSAPQGNIDPSTSSLRLTTDLSDQNDGHTVPDHSAPQGSIDPSTSSLRLTTDLSDQNDGHTVPDHSAPQGSIDPSTSSLPLTTDLNEQTAPDQLGSQENSNCIATSTKQPTTDPSEEMFLGRLFGE